jgi:multiple sugar transport system ATP-binding protein
VMVEVREAMGSEVYAHFKVDAPPVLTEDTRDLAADKGLDDLELEVHADNGSAMFVARLNPRTTAARGKPMELEVDVRRLHFFDAETGQAIR